MKQYDNSITDFELSLKIEKNNATILFFKGVALYKIKAFSEALVSLTQASVQDENKEEIYQYKGKSLLKLRKYKAALLNFNNCLVINEKYYKAVIKRCEC
jgi:tetratricopeptide (TPR) repeat protein